MSGALRLAGFEGVALKDGVRAKGNSLIPGGFYAQVGQDLTEGGEHNVEGGRHISLSLPTVISTLTIMKSSGLSFTPFIQSMS